MEERKVVLLVRVELVLVDDIEVFEVVDDEDMLVVVETVTVLLVTDFDNVELVVVVVTMSTNGMATPPRSSSEPAKGTTINATASEGTATGPRSNS